MSMSSKGLSLSQWESSKVNQIIAPLTSSCPVSRLGGLQQWHVRHQSVTTLSAPRWGLVVAMRLRSMKLKVKGKRLSSKVMNFSLSPKNKAKVRPPERLFGLRNKVPILLWYIILKLIVSIVSKLWAIIPTRLGTRSSLNGAPAWPSLGLQESLQGRFQDLASDGIWIGW